MALEENEQYKPLLVTIWTYPMQHQCQPSVYMPGPGTLQTLHLQTFQRSRGTNLINNHPLLRFSDEKTKVRRGNWLAMGHLASVCAST